MIRLTSFTGITTMIVALCLNQVTMSLRTRPSISSILTMDTAILQKQTQEKAKALLEQAIIAKGGREQLHSICNLVVSTETAYITRTGRRNQVRREYLFVLPDKYWSYEDYGSDVFGTRVEMLNYESKMQYVGTPGHPETILEPIKGSKKNKDVNYLEIALLLETKWQQPIAIEASSAVIGTKTVDLLATEISGRRVDFTLDRETHLPVRVSFYETINNKTYIDVQQLSDYIEVGGIRVPQTVKFEDGTEQKSVIKFNVKYDPAIFINPPPIGSGPNAWRPKI